MTITTIPRAPGPELQVLTVAAHEVERGDVLVGRGATVPVDTLLFHGAEGCWIYYDHRGTPLARKRMGAIVQVLRGGLSTHDTPPHGIELPIITSCGPNVCRCGAEVPGYDWWTDEEMPTHTCPCGLHYVLEGDGIEVAVYATDEFGPTLVGVR